MNINFIGYLSHQQTIPPAPRVDNFRYFSQLKLFLHSGHLKSNCIMNNCNKKFIFKQNQKHQNGILMKILHLHELSLWWTRGKDRLS